MSDSCEYSGVMRIFGIITAVSGLGGVGVVVFSSKLAANGTKICALAQFVMGISIMVALFVCYKLPIFAWIMGFIGLVSGCVNWALMVSS